MEPQQTRPYGEWPSPLTAEAVAAGSHAPDEARYVGDEAWWSEPVAAEGRTALLREAAGGGAEVVLPAPWNVRSGVHEYGGGAWTAVDGAAVFSHFADHRLHRFDGPGSTPVPLTPAGLGFRFGGLVPGVPGHVLAVREAHTGDGPGDLTRDLVLVPLDGSAADDAGAVVSVVAGSRFLAQPRLDAEGRRLAWVAWDHPHMPWEATEVCVGDLVDGRVESWAAVAGGPQESALQPEWLPDGGLAFCSDRSGWWNLYRRGPHGDVRPVVAEERETGGPLWVLGTRWYLPQGDGFLVTSTLGAEEQRDVHADGGHRLLRSDRSGTSWEDARGGRALLTDSSAGDPASLWELDTATGAFRLVRAGVEGLPAEVFPAAERRVFDGVHAVVYPPANPGWRAPVGELPPYVVLVHGGPTSQTLVRQNPAIAFYTSRGIGVLDVDYGGSTGYGRRYRQRLDGRWGVVDVEDVLTAVRGLVDAGLADGDRLAIEGGSAGGWTVLAALTRSDVFAAGISKYGVADAVALALDTHDFEARYLDGLIGPYPEAAEVYAERAPINHVDGLSSPVLLLQGLDDRVVPPEQSRLFRDAARQRGIPHALIEFPGEGHGFRAKATLIASREASLSFLGQVMGFTPPDVPVLPLER